MMAESLVELVKRVAAEYEAAQPSRGENSEKSEQSPAAPPLISLISLNSQPKHPRESADHLEAADLLDRYEERAAICQFDGDLDRARAEARAWNEVAAIWYRQHGTRTSGNLCAGCGKMLGDEAGVLLLPHGERVHTDGGYACIHAYGRRWKRQVAIALAAIGIETPTEIKAEINDQQKGF